MFMMIVSSDSYNKVIPFKEFIPETNVLDLINVYIDNKIVDKKSYMNESSMTQFSINKYDYMSTGLKGNYKDFYEYSDASNKTYLISRNEEKLKGFCGYINRLTHW
jgi:hypothetical protein